jgi:hypothetical protein
MYKEIQNASDAKSYECVMFSGKRKKGEMITINDNIK